MTMTGVMDVEIRFLQKYSYHCYKFQSLFLMAVRDVIQDHFNTTDETNFFNAVAAINAILSGRMRNLSEDENRAYGFIKEKNKLTVNKVNEYRDTQPALSTPDADWVEFKADRFDRQFLEAGALALIGVAKAMLETKRLHDYDNWQVALADKNYTDYKAKSSAAGSGFDTKAKDLARFFKKPRKKAESEE
jgi:hypothetical protein